MTKLSTIKMKGPKIKSLKNDIQIQRKKIGWKESETQWTMCSEMQMVQRRDNLAKGDTSNVDSGGVRDKPAVMVHRQENGVCLLCVWGQDIIFCHVPCLLLYLARLEDVAQRRTLLEDERLSP